MDSQVRLMGQVDALLIWRALNLSPPNPNLLLSSNMLHGGKVSNEQFIPNACNEIVLFA